MAALLLSPAHRSNRFLDLFRHLIDQAVASTERPYGTWRPFLIDRPPPLLLATS
jgi:hypothetical protein